ncbi:MAG: HAMP domain-containing histidine kinase [Treponema sp.]|nr:HAMP domain-containing histidine kinase [Treponema sp.]
MKIQTQARLLIAGIVAVPLLIILASAIHRQFIDGEDTSGLPAYEDISVLLQENLNANTWDSMMNYARRYRIIGDVVIFNENFLVLYSDIPAFSSGVITEWEDILPLLGDKQFSFYSLGREEIEGYILVNLYDRPDRNRLLPIFIPAIVIIVLNGLLTVFSICMSIVITRNITRSVKVLEIATRRIAEGELDYKIEVKGSNEIISLTKSLNKMRDALKEDELRRSRFIMGITHDLKTPLALIKGYAEAIEDGIASDAASRAEAVEIITAKTDQLENMINDLINYVRMETGEWRTKLEHISLSVFLHNLVKILKNDVELLQHTLIHEINLPENIFIQMDEKIAFRAFENLIHNAVRYTPNGSVIRLIGAFKEGNLRSSQADPDDVYDKTIELTVSDNGPGLESEDLPHIFEMFYRGSSSRREQGMGLGLSVVKWVVDYHGWSISAVSEKGNGTNFIITIPVIR